MKTSKRSLKDFADHPYYSKSLQKKPQISGKQLKTCEYTKQKTTKSCLRKTKRTCFMTMKLKEGNQKYELENNFI